VKLSILTTITNPDKRQDKWKEAIDCYRELADEVVLVDGSEVAGSAVLNLGSVKKVKYIWEPWPYEWNWVELPKHLNIGLAECTGDWVLKLDIDQFIHEDDFGFLRKSLEACNGDVATLQKMSMTYGKKFYQKGPAPIAFKNKEYIKIGRNVNRRTDLCFAVDIRGHGVELVDDYEMPLGGDLKTEKTSVSYWNYDYFFKTEEFTKEEFWRFSRAYQRYYGEWAFGDSEEKSFKKFLNMQKGRHDRAPYTYELETHSKYIRKAVEKLAPEQFGFEAWKLL